MTTPSHPICMHSNTVFHDSFTSCLCFFFQSLKKKKNYIQVKIKKKKKRRRSARHPTIFCPSHNAIVSHLLPSKTVRARSSHNDALSLGLISRLLLFVLLFGLLPFMLVLFRFLYFVILVVLFSLFSLFGLLISIRLFMTRGLV